MPQVYTPIDRIFRWRAAGVVLSLDAAPATPEDLAERLRHWAGLPPHQRASFEAASHLGRHLFGILSSKSFTPDEQTMFAAPFHLEPRLDGPGNCLVVQDDQARTPGQVVCDIGLSFPLRFAGQLGLVRFLRLLQADATYVCDRVVLCGPATEFVMGVTEGSLAHPAVEQGVRGKG